MSVPVAPPVRPQCDKDGYHHDRTYPDFRIVSTAGLVIRLVRRHSAVKPDDTEHRTSFHPVEADYTMNGGTEEPESSLPQVEAEGRRVETALAASIANPAHDSDSIVRPKVA